MPNVFVAAKKQRRLLNKFYDTNFLQVATSKSNNKTKDVVSVLRDVLQ